MWFYAPYRFGMKPAYITTWITTMRIMTWNGKPQNIVTSASALKSPCILIIN